MNLLLPGRPFIYYGEEVGMGGNSSLNTAAHRDWPLRTPMSWANDKGGFTTGTPFRALSDNIATQNLEAEQANPAGILAFYKGMLTLRNARPSIAQGSYDAPQVSGSTAAWLRTLGSERTLVVVNTGSATANVAVAQLPASASLADLYPAGGATATADASGNASLSLPAQSVRVLNVQ